MLEKYNSSVIFWELFISFNAWLPFDHWNILDFTTIDDNRNTSNTSNPTCLLWHRDEDDRPIENWHKNKLKNIKIERKKEGSSPAVCVRMNQRKYCPDFCTTWRGSSGKLISFVSSSINLIDQSAIHYVNCIHGHFLEQIFKLLSGNAPI